jgi:putative phage-type endonuclease
MNNNSEWEQARTKGIGGTDIPVLFGLSPWKTPYELWCEKTNQTPLLEENLEKAERLHWGRVMEPVIAEEYCRRRDVEVIEVPMHQDGIYIANLDRVVLDSNGAPEGILECKTSSSTNLWGACGSDVIPPYYKAQVLWYLGLFPEMKWCDIAVLFNGNNFEIYRVYPDPEWFNSVAGIVADWWGEFVVGKTPPPSLSEQDARIQWKQATAGRTKTATQGTLEVVADLQEVKAQISSLKAEEQNLRDKLLAEFEDAEVLVDESGKKVASWKNNKEFECTNWRAAVKDPLIACVISKYTSKQKGPRVLRLHYDQ